MCQDRATEAIAYHNMGLCYIGMMNTTEALECFAKQKELAWNVSVQELEGCSMNEIGHVLLQEGHAWEAEESYIIAFECFYYSDVHKLSLKDTDIRKSVGMEINPHGNNMESRTDMAWAMAGVAAGQKLWSRLTGLCRSGQAKDIRSVINFKCGRKPLNVVSRPDYSVLEVNNMSTPWNNSTYQEATDMDPSSEASWEEGFMFSAKPRNSTIFRTVGFGGVVDSERKAVRSSADIEDMMREIRELNENDETGDHLTNKRASKFIQQDKNIRKSLAARTSAAGVEAEEPAT